MAEFRDLTLTNFDGGMNLRAGDRNLKPNESPLLQNVDVVPEGGVLKSNGYVTLNTIALAVPIRGITAYNPVAGRQQIIFKAGPNYYKLNSSGSTTKLTRNNMDIARAYFTQFNDVLIITDGSDFIKTWDGTTLADMGGWPGDMTTSGQPKFSAIYRNKLLLWGDPTNPTTLYFSESGNHTGWSSAGGAFFLDVGRGDGLNIQMCKPYYDKLIVHKNRQGKGSMYSVTGSTTPGANGGDDITAIPAFDNLGSDSPLSVIEAVNDQIFITGNSIRSLTSTIKYGDVEAQTLSYRMKPITDRINKDAVDEAFALYYPKKDEIWFFIPTGSSTQNDMLLVYNIEIQAWTIKTQLGVNVSCGSIINGVPILGTYDGQIIRMDFGGRYGDQPIRGIVDTFFNSFGVPSKGKRIRHIDVTIDRVGKYNVDVLSRWDYQNFSSRHRLPVAPPSGAALWGTAVWGTAVWSKSSLKQSRLLSAVGFGKMHQLRFRNLYKDQPFQIMAVEFAVTGMGYRPTAYDEPFDNFLYDKGANHLLLTNESDYLITNSGKRLRIHS